MRFEVEHRFDAALDTVEAAMTDSAFYEQLRLPGVAPLRVVDRRDDGGLVHLRVAYEFVGQLPAIARTVLGGGRISWVQESIVDRTRHHTEFRIVPDAHADRFSCRGTYRLRPAGSMTTRTIAGELTVRVPVLGGRAERAITSGLVERLDVESEALAAWIGRNGH